MKKYSIQYCGNQTARIALDDSYITGSMNVFDAQLLCDTLNENERLKEENAALLRTQAEMLKEIMP